MSLTGEHAERVVQAVRSGTADRRSYKNMALVKAEFRRGAELVGEIRIDDSGLFYVGTRQYRSASRALVDLVCDPLLEQSLEVLTSD